MDKQLFLTMRFLAWLLTFLLLWLNYVLWIGQGSVREWRALEHAALLQSQENAQLKARNTVLAAEIADLKQALEAVEERARLELGMIKPGETFYQLVK